MEKSKVFETGYEVMIPLSNTDYYKQLTPLEQKMVYTRMMVKTTTNTKSNKRLAKKFSVSTDTIANWMINGEKLYLQYKNLK